MSSPPADLSTDWQAEYAYLLVLARLQLPRWLAPKVSASEVVQESLTKAYEKRDQFRGQGNGERRAWLRKILANGLADHARRFTSPGRNANLERSFQVGLDASSVRIDRFIAADQSSPSVRAERAEQLVQMTDALAALPEDQRTAVELKHLQGWTVEQIAESMRRGKEAVGGLLRRGMRALRDHLVGDTRASHAIE